MKETFTVTFRKNVKRVQRGTENSYRSFSAFNGVQGMGNYSACPKIWGCNVANFIGMNFKAKDKIGTEKTAKVTIEFED